MVPNGLAHTGLGAGSRAQARLYRVWNVPQAASPEEALLDLARRFSAGKTSRLYKRLVYKDQTATSATATETNNEIAGSFISL